ncbi:MAG: hypothetical protein KC505_06700 [Myxococcales bacterium]|nr:hypothetical protein [Myxococcales bacterium]USN49931.1 MAG: hypothetical protein H6731_06520 [Myxococcales bacterium]
MKKKNKQPQNEIEQDIIDTKKNLSLTKYVLFLAFIFGGGALFWGIKVALITFVILFTLWGVSTYIAFMHYHAALKRKE